MFINNGCLFINIWKAFSLWAAIRQAALHVEEHISPPHKDEEKLAKKKHNCKGRRKKMKTQSFTKGRKMRNTEKWGTRERKRIKEMWIEKEENKLKKKQGKIKERRQIEMSGHEKLQHYWYKIMGEREKEVDEHRWVYLIEIWTLCFIFLVTTFAGYRKDLR